VVSKEAEAREDRRKSLHEIMELAAAFFQAQLAARAGAHARGYLSDRGLGPATQLKFRLGYAPNERFALKEHLGAKSISVEDMIEAGLLVAGDDIPVPYDRFRDRVMFPITDPRGRVIAFGGRALQKDAPAKYLNSPETALFHKGAMLYNIAAARAAAHQGAPLVVVEGYIDVIAMVEAGFPAAVAPLGTALTEGQLVLLWKLADEPILCFDGDGAGRRAAWRVLDLALPALAAGKSLRFAALPQGQDPDDLARSGGSAAVAEVIAGAIPLADMLWQRETEGAQFDTPERRAALEARLGALAETVGDQTVRKYYREDLSARVQRLFGTARGGGGPMRGQRRFEDWRQRPGRAGGSARRSPAGAAELQAVSSPRLAVSPMLRGFRSAVPVREALILLTAVNHPWLLDRYDEELAELEFRHPDSTRLRNAILDAVAGHGHAPVEPALLREAVAGSGLGPLLERIEAAITHASDWPARPGAAESDVIQWWSHVIALHRRQRTLNRELKEAERALGEAPSDENLAWLRDLQERLAALEGSEAVIEDFGISSGRPVRGF
jgi:DNA primase